MRTSEWKRHVKEDFKETAKIKPSFVPVNEWDQQFDANLFNSHWAARTSFNDKISVLEFLFETMRDFVSSPKASKTSVTKDLGKPKYKFAEQMNEKLPETYDQADGILEPFLMPVHKYNVCVNDCIIYRKENANRMESQVCGES